MLRWMRAFGALGLLSAVGAVSFGGCVEAESRFYVGAMVPPDDEGNCPGEVEGIKSKRAYGECSDGTCSGFACLILNNGIVSSIATESNNNQVETSAITVYRVDYSYAWPDGSHEESLNVFLTVDAGGADEPSGQGYALDLFTPAASAAIAPSVPEGVRIDVVIGLIFYGRTSGGLEVETPETFIPVTVDGV